MRFIFPSGSPNAGCPEDRMLSSFVWFIQRISGSRRNSSPQPTKSRVLGGPGDRIDYGSEHRDPWRTHGGVKKPRTDVVVVDFAVSPLLSYGEIRGLTRDYSALRGENLVCSCTPSCALPVSGWGRNAAPPATRRRYGRHRRLGSFRCPLRWRQLSCDRNWGLNSDSRRPSRFR
jgi:hypothetical protein